MSSSSRPFVGATPYTPYRADDISQLGALKGDLAGEIETQFQMAALLKNRA